MDHEKNITDKANQTMAEDRPVGIFGSGYYIFVVVCPGNRETALGDCHEREAYRDGGSGCLFPVLLFIEDMFKMKNLRYGDFKLF